ncbi:unnamed protein product [Mytilus edulis]|uniref:THAP-type domain-containing protein n=1 Tax=Mytilus edulis TaxID=6550 RepID=A0A8S3TS05_MYTED|nr:unnamed protein product [Mytilus edulis]
MVVSCCVIKCTTIFNNGDPKSFYRVPKKPDTRRQLWISAIKREGPEGKPCVPADHDRVCYRHFITEADKDQQEAASVLLDISENLPPPTCIETTEDLHGPCIKKIAALRIENELLHEKLGRLQASNITLRKEVTDSGVPNKAIFMWLVSFCLTILPSSKLMSPSNILLCILMKLRLNIQHQDIAYRFKVSVTTVSDIFNKGIPKLAEKLSFLVQWPDKDNLIKNMPIVFKLSYPRCISIIDCFEVFIQRPANLTARAQTWSNYKHHNTIKFLVSITPTGAISFVSKAFGGRTSDKVITQRSGFLDKLEHGDQVLADRGLLIAEELASRHASLVIPAFTKGKSQLSAKEVEQTRTIVHVRIHVERAIEQLKNILSSNMSIYLVPHSDSIVTLCSAVCNLHPKLVS